MALDGAFLHAIKNEIQQKAIGARIDKIHQPSKEDIVIVLRKPGAALKLFVSAGANSPRIHFTDNPPENPKTPPMFCMLLRKLLGTARLINIHQLELDRAIYLDFEAKNELGDQITITLAVEIMGRHSNIIILNSDGKIIDSIKRVDRTMSELRMILPGMDYTPLPPQNKLNILSSSNDEIISTLKKSTARELPKAIMQTLQGVSPILAREISTLITRCNDLNMDELSDDHFERAGFFLNKIRELLLNQDYNFTVVLEGNRPKDFSFINITQYGTYMSTRSFDSASELLDNFYSERDRVEKMKQRSHDLLKLLVNTSERINRKLEMQKAELSQSEKRDVYKLWGDLLSSNSHQIKKGQASAILNNFYDNNNKIEIPLDRLLTPIENSQKYYNLYKKAAKAEKMLTTLIERSKKELEYIDSVFDAVTRTGSESELIEIREELAEQGYIKSSAKQNKMLKAKPPIKYKSSDGFIIYCGRNNKQNDKLTLKQAAKHDIWLHTHNIPGSHVIVVSDGKEVPKATLEQACIIAAYNSKARNSSQVAVDYTMIKNVKKPSGAKPGMVIFKDNKTAYVTPDEQIVNDLVFND